MQTVIRSNQIKAPYPEELWLTNNESDPVEVSLGAPAGPDGSVFTVEPMTLTVQPGGAAVHAHAGASASMAASFFPPGYLIHGLHLPN